MKPEIYISIDIEADGPVPGLNSMLSFAAAAFSLQDVSPRIPISTYSATLETIQGSEWPECKPSQSTMEWWKTQPVAWEACRKNIRSPKIVMPEFLSWCRRLQQRGNLVIIGYPVAFDMMFVYWYTMVFGGLKDGERCPFGFQGLDIKTLAAEKLGLPYREATKKNMPKKWFEGAPMHTHEALDDAIGQGVLFVNMVLG